MFHPIHDLEGILYHYANDVSYECDGCRVGPRSCVVGTCSIIMWVSCFVFTSWYFLFALMDEPRWSGAQTGSRRQKPRYPERRRAGKRGQVEYIYVFKYFEVVEY